MVVLADAPLKVERRKPLTANVGVVSVGLDTYWKQCPGLYDDMLKKAAVFENRVAAHQVNVSSFGISDNPQKAASLIPAMKAADLDLLFVDMVTYATSSTFAPFVRELKCPIVLVALQPDSRLDYEHATIYKQLYNDDLCSVPEFTGVAIRYGRPVADVVIGQLEGDAKADEEIRQWCAVAHVLAVDKRNVELGRAGDVADKLRRRQPHRAHADEHAGAKWPRRLPDLFLQLGGAHRLRCATVPHRAFTGVGVRHRVELRRGVQPDEPPVLARSRAVAQKAVHRRRGLPTAKQLHRVA